MTLVTGKCIVQWQGVNFMKQKFVLQNAKSSLCFTMLNFIEQFWLSKCLNEWQKHQNGQHIAPIFLSKKLHFAYQTIFAKHFHSSIKNWTQGVLLLTSNKVQGLAVSLLLRNLREIRSPYRHYEDLIKAPPTYSYLGPLGVLQYGHT